MLTSPLVSHKSGRVLCCGVRLARAYVRFDVTLQSRDAQTHTLHLPTTTHIPKRHKFQYFGLPVNAPFLDDRQFNPCMQDSAAPRPSGPPI